MTLARMVGHHFRRGNWFEVMVATKSQLGVGLDVYPDYSAFVAAAAVVVEVGFVVLAWASVAAGVVVVVVVVVANPVAVAGQPFAEA